jgi:hypothetical protein
MKLSKDSINIYRLQGPILRFAVPPITQASLNHANTAFPIVDDP